MQDETTSSESQLALAPIPESERQPWYVTAIIFGGLEFAIPVLMAGGILISNFSFLEMILILLVGLGFFQWIGNAVQGYIGAKTGLSTTALGSLSFGTKQSKIIVGLVVLCLTLGWWAIQTAVATDALCALLAIEKADNYVAYFALTTVIGLLFAIPSILGHLSIKWVDYIAMPAGLLLVFAAIYLSVDNFGWDALVAWNPEGKMTFLEGISLVIGINVSQWLIVPDYTRFAKPNWKDNILIPLGIILVGFPLFMVGGLMSVGTGNADIVQVMQNLGFPTWGFLVLWVATWTSQMISNYTGGLVLCNLFNLHSANARKKLTVVFALMGIVLALMGIMSQFINFLYLLAVVIPALASIPMTHYFLLRNKMLAKGKEWNWLATASIIAGVVVGYVSQYTYSIGIPAVQTLLITGLIYWLLNKLYPVNLEQV